MVTKPGITAISNVQCIQSNWKMYLLYLLNNVLVTKSGYPDICTKWRITLKECFNCLYFFVLFLRTGSLGCGQKSFTLVWRCQQLLLGLLAKGQLPRVSRQPRLSANDKDGNEVMPRAVHRSPSIWFAAEENPGKPQLLKALWPLIPSNENR